MVSLTVRVDWCKKHYNNVVFYVCFVLAKFTVKYNYLHF